MSRASVTRMGPTHRPAILTVRLRLLKHWASAWTGILAATLFASTAAAETYFRDSTVEVSGSGMRSSRNCTVVLLPARALGDTQAPRLTLSTDGLARLSFGIENPAQYESTALVQNNARLPFIGGAGAAPQQFLSSDVGKAIKSQRLFFVTARRTDTGKFVSSRYERIDFDAILRRIEANCPFDAEALMSDTFERERAERALAVSQSDLKLIRWALNKRMTNSSSEPEARTALSPAERAYLKRYAAENALPASQYLTAELVQKLKSEGAVLANLAAPPQPPRPSVASGLFTFKLCNHSSVPIAVALSHHVSPTDERFLVEGWWVIEQGECKTRMYPKGWFYFYGEQRNSGGKKYWGRNDLLLCVNYPGPFERVNTSNYKCDKQRLKGFYSVNIEPERDEYTFNMYN